MAAKRECFSAEQVIEEVCGNGDTRNYSEFREDVSSQLQNVYHRREKGVHGTDKVLLSSLPAWPMISCEVLIWLRGIKRQMLANPKATNPWSIELKRDLP